MIQTLSKMQSHEKSPSKIDFQNAKTQIFSKMKKNFIPLFLYQEIIGTSICTRHSNLTINDSKQQ